MERAHAAVVALLRAVDEEESRLVRAAVGGDRAAFDALYDRYFRRVAGAFRDLPEREARARIRSALEALFASLPADDGTPLAARAFRVVRASRPASTSVPHSVAARARRPLDGTDA